MTTQIWLTVKLTKCVQLSWLFHYASCWVDTADEKNWSWNCMVTYLVHCDATCILSSETIVVHFYCKSSHQKHRQNHLWCVTRGVLLVSLHRWLELWSALMLGGASLSLPCSAAASGVQGRCCSLSPTCNLLLQRHSADMSGALDRDEHGEQKSWRGGELDQIPAATK